MRGARVVVTAVLVGGVVAGCTHDDAIDAPAPRTPTTGNGSGTQVRELPDLCDHLMSALVPTQVLRVRLPPARSYTQLSPQPASGLRDGLRCEHGIDASGPTLTVLAREYDTTARARGAARLSQPGGQARRVAGLPAVLVAGPSSTSLRVLATDVVLSATLRAGVVDPAQTPQALLAIGAAVVGGLSGNPA